MGDENSYYVYPWSARGKSSLGIKAEGLAESLELPPDIEIVDGALCSGTPASEPKITNPDEVHETISVLKVGKAKGPNSITKKALKHLPSERYPWSLG